LKFYPFRIFGLVIFLLIAPEGIEIELCNSFIIDVVFLLIAPEGIEIII